VKLQEYIVVGDPLHKETTVGPLSSQKSKDDLVKQVKESIEKGATVAFGSLEYSPEDENLKNGAYFYPMILENPQPGSPAHDEELFGPVFTLHRFSSVEEAIDKANAIRYGLSASVFTKNLALAKKMAN
jgi:succinate-semialdehyde dehydrogenase/glutarate-semialdehyde dehydrogenase